MTTNTPDWMTGVDEGRAVAADPNSPTPETDSQAFKRATNMGVEWTGITANMTRGPVEAFRAGFMAARAETASQSSRIAELTEQRDNARSDRLAAEAQVRDRDARIVALEGALRELVASLDAPDAIFENCPHRVHTAANAARSLLTEGR